MPGRIHEAQAPVCNSTLAIWEDTPCRSGTGEQPLTWHEATCGGRVEITHVSSAFCSYTEQPCW
jgi:hypothetical protein